MRRLDVDPKDLVRGSCWLQTDITRLDTEASAGWGRTVYLARVPWAVDLLEQLPDSTQDDDFRVGAITNMWRVPGIARLYRRRLGETTDRRTRYGWAAMIERAEPGCPEWRVALRDWALHDPEPLDHSNEFHWTRSEPEVGPRGFVGGDGAMLMGLEAALRKDAREGNERERAMWRRGLERLWGHALDRWLDPRQPTVGGGTPLNVPGFTDSYVWKAPGELFRLLLSQAARKTGETETDVVRAALQIAGLPLEPGDPPPKRNSLPLGCAPVREAWVANVARCSVILNGAKGAAVALDALVPLAARFGDEVADWALRELDDQLTHRSDEPVPYWFGRVFEIAADLWPERLAQMLSRRAAAQPSIKDWLMRDLRSIATAWDGSIRAPLVRLERDLSS